MIIPYEENEKIKSEIQALFYKLIWELNRLNVEGWSELFSKNGFLSAIIGTNHYNERNEFIKAIKEHCEIRKYQTVKPVEVNITPLNDEIAMLTSEEYVYLILNSGESLQARHVFTLLWKKEKERWKIIHSHESWIENFVN